MFICISIRLSSRFIGYATIPFDFLCLCRKTGDKLPDLRCDDSDQLTLFSYLELLFVPVQGCVCA